MNAKELDEGAWTRLLPSWLAVLAAVGFAGFFTRSSYESPRPPSPHVEWDEHHDVGTFEALVTDDPVRAAHRAREALRAAGKGAAESGSGVLEMRRKAELQRLKDALKSDGERPTLLMVMWQAGGDWPEECERRVRARHAVVTALSLAWISHHDRSEGEIARGRASGWSEFARS